MDFGSPTKRSCNAWMLVCASEVLEPVLPNGDGFLQLPVGDGFPVALRVLRELFRSGRCRGGEPRSGGTARLGGLQEPAKHGVHSVVDRGHLGQSLNPPVVAVIVLVDRVLVVVIEGRGAGPIASITP